jgi:hypothetical protein
MATKTPNQGFLDGNQSPEKIRREFIDKPLSSAKLSALNTGLELFNLMSVLPDAFISSQRRELDRLKASGKDNDERVKKLEASIEQATVLRTTVQRGESRVQRALGSLGDSEIAFHGFVSDSDLNPVAGLTVRLSGREGSAKRGLTAITEDDGYFRIPLGAKKDTGKEWRSRVGKVNFAEKINILTEEQAAATGSANDATATGRVRGQVEILEGDKSIYTDPTGVPIDEGSVYREYVVQADSRPSHDYDSSSFEEPEVDVAQTVSARRAPRKKAAKKASKK